MEKLKPWNKIISIVGFVTLELGHFTNSNTLIIIGGISTIIGITTMIFIKNDI